MAINDCCKAETSPGESLQSAVRELPLGAVADAVAMSARILMKQFQACFFPTFPIGQSFQVDITAVDVRLP